MVYQRYTRITVLIESLYPPLTQLCIHYPSFYKTLFLLLLKRTTAVLRIALNCITYFRKNRYEILTYWFLWTWHLSLRMYLSILFLTVSVKDSPLFRTTRKSQRTIFYKSSNLFWRLHTLLLTKLYTNKHSAFPWGHHFHRSLLI